MRGTSHMLRDSEHLCSELENLDLSDQDVLYRIDVREFYMSGTHKDLVAEVSSIFSGVMKTLISRVLEFLLFYQFVTCDLLPGRFWQVLTGGGQGTTFAGALADCCFWVLAERRFALLPSVRSRALIKHYSRFKDDIFVVAAPNLGWLAFWLEFLARARFYKMQYDKVSQTEVTMLDLRVFKGERFSRCGRLDIGISFKPTSLGVPLSTSSAHSSACRRSWARAEVYRFARRVTSREELEKAKDVLLGRLSRFCFPSEIVSAVRQCHPPLSRSRSRILLYPSWGATLWLPLPWHASWEGAGFTKAASSICKLFRRIHCTCQPTYKKV